MHDFSAEITSTRLWSRLSPDLQLQGLVHGVRSIAGAIAAKASETVPEYTDHSIAHMDALWRVTEVVFSAGEIERFSTAEAFILACTFYVHDLGMAAAATPEGRTALEASPAFRACYDRMCASADVPPERAKSIALREAARAIHAANAELLATQPLPGLGRHLIENTDARNRWGAYIGQVASSHHWTLADVENHLGCAGRVPAPNGDTIDLGFLACALRVIDYAHINCDRAPVLDRLLRSEMSSSSLVHWRAQEWIAGPQREGAHLVYGSMRPIEDVDAWWTFYEMASGLDREITDVSDYLAGRPVSNDRFSLDGVKGVKSPTAFAKLVRPGRFSPVDVRFRPDSMPRLVQLLGGKQLYGNDRYAPLRELLQNGRDAIHLQRAVDLAAGREANVGLLDVRLETEDGATRLTVSDDGVGMNQKTVTSYLLGIASDFWQSPDFFGEFPGAATHGFSPVGRFGIGFLSVFMLGDEVEVETQRVSGPNLHLKLRGVGERGSLHEKASALRAGTTVRVTLAPRRAAEIDGLARIVQAKAPMLDVPVRVTQAGTTVKIEPEWWKTASQEDLTAFLANRHWRSVMPTGEYNRRRLVESRYYVAHLRDVAQEKKWPGLQPESTSDNRRIIATPSASRVTICSKGFAVVDLHLPGVSGVAEIGEVEINAARTLPIGFDEADFRSQLIADLWPKIVQATNALRTEGSIPSRFTFLRELADIYGRRLLEETSLPWIGVVEPPGNTVLISSPELRGRAAKSSEVFLAYNTSPWSADYWIRQFYGNAVQPALVVVVPRGSGPEVRTSYGRDEGRIDAELPTHFVPNHYDSEDGETHLHKAHLLLAVLDAIAAGWGATAQSLYSEGWSRQQGALIGRLRRNG